MRFLGLTLSDPVPDAKTIWLFRERLVKASAIDGLFNRFDAIIRCPLLRWPMTGSTAARRLKAFLTLSVTPRFWPEVKTFSRRLSGALWPL